MADSNFTPDRDTLFCAWYGLKETGEIINNIMFTLGALERLARHEEKIDHDELAAILNLIESQMETASSHRRRAEDFLDGLHKTYWPEIGDNPPSPHTHIH